MVNLRNKRIESNDTRIARDAGTTEPTSNIPEEGQLEIAVGHVYREKNADSNAGAAAEVIPYNVDFGSAHVNFSNVGRSNEELMRTSDFLNRFEHVGEVNASSLAEKQVERPSDKKDTERA